MWFSGQVPLGLIPSTKKKEKRKRNDFHGLDWGGKM